MDENTYKLIITNRISFDRDKSLIIKKLAVLFKTSEQKAEQLLNKDETVIKSRLDRATAEKYLAAIHKTGANCKMVNTALEELTLKENHQNLNALGDISEKSFCTECGTIKDSTAACLNCGFDPQTDKTKNKEKFKKILKYSGITLGLIAAIIITYQFALPFYKIYANKQKIEQGLGLAFDTRDKITVLILKTNFWPNQNIDANLPKQISNDIIESLVVGENALITVTLRAEALKLDSSKTIIFKPALLKGKLVWNCTKGTLKNEFRPDNCKSNNQ